ncbi:MAG: GyrI-like domain-containing protein, partial [Xanthobacteraceae bacterium]
DCTKVTSDTLRVGQGKTCRLKYGGDDIARYVVEVTGAPTHGEAVSQGRFLAFTLWRPPTDGRLDMEPGIVVSRALAPLGEVVPSALPAGRTAHLLLTGPYDGIPGAWNRLFAWCAGERLTLAGTNWQIYGDENDDPAKLTTALHALLA